MNTLKSKPLVAPKIWKRDEILTFLDIFESTFHASVEEPFESEEDMWKCVADKLLEQGISASVQQCINKWNFLYKTYISNQNRQGVFYAKVKRIVEFSQELNEQQESVETVADEQVVEYDSEAFIKQEKPSHDAEREEIEDHLNEHEENHDHIEEIVTSHEETLEENTALDLHDVQPESQCDSVAEMTYAETPAKKIKLSDDVDTVTGNSSQQSPKHFTEENTNLRDILQTILGKINAIQDEQIRQGHRIADIEKRQDEHKSILLDIKKHIGFK
ncbi:uncharacterized protein LOC5565376 [Aedes aegypti]|uniref:Myb/SANT-like DNA-binding domain-containing protein n=1 Tax=Aedes aegypti TaxID=7159 RepID=A0A1S4F8K9_AEDAE|nr:uncharacterized protein LOC5565376 [Aedes aegypti]